MEPAQEFPGCLLDGRPEPVALVPLVIGQECGQDLILDLLAGRGYPASDKAHHIGIGIQVHQVVRIGSSEPPEHQPVRLKENPHRPVPPIPPRYRVRSCGQMLIGRLTATSGRCSVRYDDPAFWSTHPPRRCSPQPGNHRTVRLRAGGHPRPAGMPERTCADRPESTGRG
jgi:hypothetical protein